jgi:hypothetical protein
MRRMQNESEVGSALAGNIVQHKGRYAATFVSNIIYLAARLRGFGLAAYLTDAAQCNFW